MTGLARSRKRAKRCPSCRRSRLRYMLQGATLRLLPILPREFDFSSSSCVPFGHTAYTALGSSFRRNVSTPCVFAAAFWINRGVGSNVGDRSPGPSVVGYKT